VAGQPVQDDELRDLVRELQEDIVRHGLTFFEAATGLAFHLFERRSVDVAVVEVGLGGRLDATNVVEPLITAITNVAKDHSEYLGESLHDITREKAGIIKAGVPLLTAERDESLLSILEEHCDRVGAPFRPLRVDPPSMELEITESRTCFTAPTRAWGSIRIRTPLVGEHQAVNGALSAAILGDLPVPLRPDVQTVLEGIEGVNWPGRSQVVRLDGQAWLFDVAHNLAGAQALASVLDGLTLPRPVILLTAVLGDKDWRAILPPLLEKTDHAVFTQAPSAPLERRWSPRKAAADVGRPGAEICPDFDRALQRAKALAGSGTIVVTGSNHTVGDALRALDLSPF
jgi:dihydrofolate synthase/folylpolyglutamate synthase